MEIDGYTISLNRGDEVIINIQNKENLPFMVGDMIKFSITKKGNMTDVLFQKTFTIEEENSIFGILLTSDDTRFCPPLKQGFYTYWYEIEHNGITTLVGFDKEGGKEFIIYPEAISAEESGE